MTVYWLSCAASVLLAYLCSRTPRGRSNRFLACFFSSLPLMLISALRYDVGYDYLPTYVSYFQTVKNGMVNDANRLEWLWHLLNSGLAALNADSMWLFAVAAIVFFLCVYADIFRSSPYPGLSVFLLVGMGYLFASYNAVRQMVGCAILMYSLRHVESRKPGRFLLCVAIAGGFHNSCYLFVLVYWLSKVKIKPLGAFVLTAAAALLMAPLSQLFRFLISKTAYQIYLSSIFDTGETAYVMLAINFIVLAFASVLYRDEPRYRIYYNLQIVAVLITLYSGQVVLILRLMWAFGLPSIVLVALAVERIADSKDRRIVISVLTLMYFLYATYTVGVQNSNSVLPYQTVFSRWLS